MNILISGGGVAGLTLGYWLHRYGHTPTIIEQAAGLRRDGYGIDFFGTGYDVAERMGIIDRLQRQSMPIESIQYVDADGRPTATLDMALMQRVMRGKYMALMHWTLEETLYDALADEVEVRFGCSIAAVQQTDAAVQVTFDDGTTQSFDLLIGADGVYSNTRRLVFGPDAQFEDYLGYYVACYRLPDRYGIGHAWKNYVEVGRQVGAYCSNHPDEIITLFMWRSADEGPVPREQRLATLHTVFAGMDWLAKPLLEAATAATPIWMGTVTQIHMPAWSQGRVCLVGDACGCMTLVSGQGASMALGSAYVLAEELHTAADYHQAFARYEQRLRPPIESRQRNARDFAKSFVPGSRLSLKLQQVAMKIVLRPAFAGVLRRMFGAESILHTDGFQRLPQSQATIVGYELDGKLRASDYRSFVLDVQRALKHADDVRVLLSMKDVAGVSWRALWEDLKFGRRYGRAVRKLAIVGDQRWTSWLTTLARLFYHDHVQHFRSNELRSAWSWVGAAS